MRPSKALRPTPGTFYRVRRVVALGGLLVASMGVLATSVLVVPAGAHENPTAYALGLALRSCDRNYSGVTNGCTVYGSVSAGPHSYKWFVQWYAGTGVCRAAYTMSHNETIIEHHPTYCGVKA